MIATIFIHSTVLSYSLRVLMVGALTHFCKLFMALSSEVCCTIGHSYFTIMHFIAVSQSMLTE